MYLFYAFLCCSREIGREGTRLYHPFHNRLERCAQILVKGVVHIGYAAHLVNLADDLFHLALHGYVCLQQLSLIHI